MQMSSTTTWWLTFLMVAIQGATTITWSQSGLDPKILFWISQGGSYLTLLLTFAIHGTIPGVNAVSMPGTTPTVPPVVKAVIAFFVIILLSMLLMSPVSAQGLPPLKPLKPLTGDLAKDLATDPTTSSQIAPGLPNLLLGGQTKEQMVALFNNILKATKDDLTYAVAMATAANKSAPTGFATAAGMRLTCLVAIQTLNSQISGANLADPSGKALTTRPDPALFTNAETFAEIIDTVQPGGPLWNSCSGAAQLANTSIISFINALVSGAAGAAILAPK